MLICVALAAVVSNGAQAIVHGGIIEGCILAADGAPVPWAWVTLSSADSTGMLHQAITGPDGHFVFGGLAPGAYALCVSHVGFLSPAATVFYLSRGEAKRLGFCVYPRLHTQPPIVVAAPRSDWIDAGTQKVLAGDRVARRGGVLGDPMRALATLPGVRSPNDFDGRVRMRGASPFETGYLLDGIPLPFAYHLGGLASIFDPDAIDEIRFYTGGHPASMGPGSAGIVSVRSRRGQQNDGTSARVVLSPLTLGGRWQGTGGHGKLNGFISLRGTYHDLLFRAFDVGTDVTVPNFTDGQCNAGWQFGANHRIDVRTLRSSDAVRMRLGDVSSSSARNQLHMSGNLRRVAVVWSCMWPVGAGEVAGARATVAYQPFEYDVRVRGDDVESMDWASKSTIFGAETFWERQGHRCEAGITRVRHPLNYRINMARGFWSMFAGDHGEGSIASDPVTFERSGSRDVGGWSAFVQDGWAFAPRWLLSLGMRMESFRGSGERYFDPRVTLRWSDSGTALHTAWGVYHDHPSGQIGDPTGLDTGLMARRSTHRILGIRQSLGRWGILAAETFQRSTENLASEVKPGIYSSVGRGWSAGMEVQWSWTESGRELSAMYGFGRSVRWDPDGPLSKTVERFSDGSISAAFTHKADRWYLSPHDPGHSAELRAAAPLAPGLLLELSWRLRSGAPSTPVNEVVTDSFGHVLGIDGARGSTRLPVYHRLDIRLERAFRNSWGHWRAYLEVMNAYNRTNVFQASYDETFSRRIEYRMLPVLPILGISLDF